MARKELVLMWALPALHFMGRRHHFLSIFKNLSRSQPDEKKEPLPYRSAVLGLVGGLVFLLAFSYKGGMPLWTGVLYFLVYCLLAMGLTRGRA